LIEKGVFLLGQPISEQALRTMEQELNVKSKQINQVITLLEEGNTVPFIARYRKELTGGLDEVQIKDIMDRWTYLQNLASRKEEVTRLIEEQGKLTEELKKAITHAQKLQDVEDIYRPYKQKRRTKATAAKEKGLEPLAHSLLEQNDKDPETVAREYINEEKEVYSAEDALAGAKDIIAEIISDDAEIRKWIREDTFSKGEIKTEGKNTELDEKKVFEMYYEYQEPIRKIVPHRVLAVNRGEKENILKVAIGTPSDLILSKMEKKIIKRSGMPAAPYIREAMEDAYKRLISPSIEREIRTALTEQAEERAIHIFSENVRSLLLQAPLKGKVVLGVDPAYRTGCKLGVVDETGRVLHIQTIYPTPPRSEVEKSAAVVKKLIDQYDIQIVAIGNGTASRETEQFIADSLKDLDRSVAYVIVNEAGASVYSASSVAREEFPDLQVEERSAVSIARRLQDPLAELVKIDPKSIGVGQYQHDVSQKRLGEEITFVVETAVNQVGVNVNTASSSLLQYVSGLSKTVAQNIILKRNEVGKFKNRSELKKIPRLGTKTYEQCIGFLRVVEGEQPLDQTGIHPESYPAAKALLKELSFTPADIGSDALAEKLKMISLEAASEKLDIGVPTLKDIIDGLTKPGRDPRDAFSGPALKTDVLKMEDLSTGMELQGTVRNVVDFGAFVDIGVKQDGLVHISKLTNRFVKNPMDVVSVGQVVTVWVDSVDVAKQRIALTMISPK
jgi:protein Tex